MTHPTTPAVPEPLALGLDLSLTSTGVGSPLGWTARIRPRTRGLDRLRLIVSRIHGYADAGRYALAAIEGPSFGHSGFRQHEELVALRWMVYDRLDAAEIPYVLIPPSTLKLWATGNGKADKVAVAAAMDARHPRTDPDERGFVDGKRYDEADALALADMGTAWLNTWCLSPVQQRAMKGVAWPEQEVTLR